MSRLKAAASAAFALVVFASSWLPMAAADDGNGGHNASPPGVGHLVFNSTTSQVVGSYVQFRVPDHEAVLADFEAHGVLFFDTISVAGFEGGDQEFDGSEFSATGRPANVQVNDNP